MKRTLTPELIKDIASRFQTRKEFQDSDASAYQCARRLGILDEVCNHMSLVNRIITRDMAESIAINFNTRTELAKKHQSVYKAIIKNSWSETAFAHMTERKKLSYSIEYMTELAGRFSTRSEFQDFHPS